jgi:hypothetical protein
LKEFFSGDGGGLDDVKECLSRARVAIPFKGRPIIPSTNKLKNNVNPFFKEDTVVVKELIDVIKEFGVAVNDFFGIWPRGGDDRLSAFGRRLGSDSFHGGGLAIKLRAPTINFRARKN